MQLLVAVMLIPTPAGQAPVPPAPSGLVERFRTVDDPEALAWPRPVIAASVSSEPLRSDPDPACVLPTAMPAAECLE